jgi:hypothetical protein
MATTPNFSWPTPDNTDLVKNGALAIRTLGDAIDASLVDLEGGTTGQVLSKTSNTDMDFTWVTTDDANAIQNAIVDAKGDLIAATANDTPARLAVGANNSLLTAASGEATGLKYAGLWTTYTPTLSGITLGNGSILGQYCQIADTTFFRVRVTFGSTTSFTAAVDISLPTTSSGYSTFDYMNIITQAYDSSATVFSPSSANINISSTTFRTLATVVSATYPTVQDLSASVPISWATGDTLTAQGSYRNT